MSNKNSSKFWVRLSCLILAALMIAGVATTAVFMILDAIEEDKHNHTRAYTQIALPEYDEKWSV